VLILSYLTSYFFSNLKTFLKTPIYTPLPKANNTKGVIAKTDSMSNNSYPLNNKYPRTINNETNIAIPNHPPNNRIPPPKIRGKTQIKGIKKKYLLFGFQ
jgi:hypothetical protein